MGDVLAAALIKGHEPLKLKAERTRKGLWAIGYGHTLTAKRDQQITAEEAEKLLAADIECTRKLLAWVLAGLALTEAQEAVLVSFTRRVGLSELRRSQFLTHLRSGDLVRAAGELLPAERFHFLGSKA